MIEAVPALKPPRRKSLQNRSAPAAPRAALPAASLTRWGEGWLLDCELRRHSPATGGLRRMILKNFAWLAAREGWTEIGKEQVRVFLGYLSTGHLDAGGRWGNPQMTRTVRPVTVHTYHSHLRTFFSWLVLEGVLGVSPMATIRPPVARADQVQPFTTAQVEALLAATGRSWHPARDAAIVWMLLDTGIRAAELCALTLSDLDLPERRITIRHGKGDKGRTVYFGLHTGKALWRYNHSKQRRAELAGEEWAEEQNPEAPLFPAENGSRRGEALSPRGLGQQIERLGERVDLAGVRCSPHTFRHAQPLDSPVLTPDGWKQIGYLRVGDEVVGSDGHPTTVLGIYPQGQQPVVRLTFDDNASVQCTLDHLWTVWEPAARRSPRYPIVPKTLSTREIIESGQNWHFPLVGAVEFQQQGELSVPPYLLGALLGDGHFGKSLIMAGSAAKQEVMDRVEQLLPLGHRISGTSERYLLAGVALFAENDNVGAENYYKARPGGNGLLEEMRRLGLSGTKSETKFIPPQYLFATVDERMELLRGLMDTDGNATRHASAEFTTISERLALDVVHLVRSLGGTARINKRLPYAAAKNYAYRLCIRTPFTPFHVADKQERYESRPKQPFVRRLVGHESVGVQDCVCIQVANADSLYVTQDFVVTHNTFAIMYLRAGGQQFALKEILGHTSLSMTTKYVQFAEADLAGQRRFSPGDRIRGKITQVGRPKNTPALSKPKPKPLADDHAPRKLSPLQVREIRATQGTAETRQQIADRYGVSVSMIKQIRSGAVWGDVK